MENNPVVQTTVQSFDAELADIFGGSPVATNSPATQPTKTEIKPGLFSREIPSDFSFLNTPAAGADEAAKSAEAAANSNTPGAEDNTSIDDIVNEPEAGAEGTDPSKAAGRPKTDKSGVVDLFKREIEAGRMVTFDDYDETKQTLDQYLGGLNQKDLDELWNANQSHSQTSLRNTISQEFFESLPTELQYAYQYAANGGTDMKSLFKALSQFEETRTLDENNDADQRSIARQFLKATDFGTDQEIEEEINTWVELAVLDKKAKQFKPKLDQMQERVIQQQLAKQAQIKKQEEQTALAFAQHTYSALETGDINGLKLDKKTQGFLYNNMVSAQYPSLSGKGTNLLNHLLEKYQFVEPNYALVTEALWLLSDPEAYRAKVMTLGANKNVETTARALKTEQGRKQGNASDIKEDEAHPRSTKIPRNNNIFRR